MSDFIFYLELERWYYFIKFYEIMENFYSTYGGICFIFLFSILPTVILCFLLDKKIIETILLIIFAIITYFFPELLCLPLVVTNIIIIINIVNESNQKTFIYKNS